MREPKFKVGEKVYFYDYRDKKIKKDKIAKIVIIYSFIRFYSFLLNDNQIEKFDYDLHLTFEECKKHTLQVLNDALVTFMAFLGTKYVTTSDIEHYKNLIEKLEKQEEVK